MVNAAENKRKGIYMEENEVKETKKKDSRKFLVWLTWLFVTILVIAWCAIVMIITKTIAETMISLAEKVLCYFFAISMMYLGVNVGQKMGFAFADALTAKYESVKEADSE